MRLQREKQAIAKVKESTNNVAEAAIKGLKDENAALKDEKEEIIKERHEVIVYHVSKAEKLHNTIQRHHAENVELKKQIAKLRADNANLRADNAKLWAQNDRMAERGLELMAKF
jgi:predicted RNase H-like nuclease (RuvC/YqgF family)